ncbi:MAG: hypothetical protein N2645_21085 [Clostridia bacterium]|nr:hypothetical protein [Clostridia bacterium]
MVNGNTKRIVVIKDIPSNIIEEAILILKCDPSPKNTKASPETQAKNRKKENDYLLKEAELIINDYIKQNKVQDAQKVTPKETRSPKKRRIMTNTFINAALIGSIVLLIFLITKVI